MYPRQSFYHDVNTDVRINYVLIGVDGSRWPFGSPGCPVRLADDPWGIGRPSPKHQMFSDARERGGTWYGMTFDAQAVTLDVHLGPVTPGWPGIELLRRWRRALGHGDELLELQVRFEGRIIRQKLRASDIPTKMPLAQMRDAGYAREVVRLQNDLSRWEGDPRTYTFTPGDWATAKVHPRGDLAVPLKYTIYGPIVHPTVGLAGQGKTIPLTIGPEASLIIETDPTDSYVRDHNGVNRRRQAGVVTWADQVAKPQQNNALELRSASAQGVETSRTRIEVTVPEWWSEAVSW